MLRKGVVDSDTESGLESLVQSSEESSDQSESKEVITRRKCCKRICRCCCACLLIPIVLLLLILLVLSLIPTSAFPKEVQILLSDKGGFGNWLNLFFGLGGAAYDLQFTCPPWRGVEEHIPPQCIVDVEKFQALGENIGGSRLPLACGMHAFDPRRLSKQWCEDAGLQFDNVGGPDSPCGTMVSGTVANLPSSKINGGASAIVDLTGLFWMNNNTATQHIGEQLMTFGGSVSEPLTADEISFFTERDQGLLRSKGITKDTPDFKVQLNPHNPDARWSYDDRCISTNGIMRAENALGANEFTFYFWDTSGTSGTMPFYAEINKHDWAEQTIWTFEARVDNSSQMAGSQAFRGIYAPRSTEPGPLSYLVVKVLSGDGEPVINHDGSNNWANFMAFLEKWCITSLFTWKGQSQCERYCGLEQLNMAQGGCQRIEWNGGLHVSPSQEEANFTAQNCCHQCMDVA